MSAIAGLYHVDGRPVDPALLRRMLDALAHRGPDGEGQWVSGPLGLGHRLLHTTPESLNEKQPVTDERDECWLVWDGRLDNREELIAALKAEGRPLGDQTDPELVLGAYRQWGMGSLKRIVGEFALALWDQRTRRLICARDPIGVKPFYYHWDGRRFLFASEIKALLAVPGVAKKINEAMIADYLLADFRDPDATFFDGIKQLRPAHWLCVEHGQMRMLRYWEPNPSAWMSDLREDDCFERFREVLREAVRCRLRSQFPIAVMLSGGVDSTSVTAMAETLRQERTGHPDLTALTVLVPDFLQEEWETIQRLIQRFGTDVQTIRSETNEGLGRRLDFYLSPSETPFNSGIFAHPFVFGPARARGCRIILTGFGADELERGSEVGILKDLWRGWHWMSLLRAVRRFAWGLRTSHQVILLQLRDQLPPRLRWALRTLRGTQVPSWIEPGFAKRLRLARRLPLRLKPTSLSMSQEESLRAVAGPWMVLHLNQLDIVASTSMMEWRHPFLDRRLIEFFLSVPLPVKLQAGFRKPFTRHVVAELASGLLQERESVEYLIPPQDDQMSRILEAKQFEEVLCPPNSFVFRYVKRHEIPRLLKGLVRGRFRNRTPLWQLMHLQRWLNEFFPEERQDGGKAGEVEPGSLVTHGAGTPKGGVA